MRIFVFILLLFLCRTSFSQSSIDNEILSKNQCIEEAANYHQVNQYILFAILKIETNLRPQTITKNVNDTIDVGAGGMNSIHFKELAKWGIKPNDLLDFCTASYVAAWHLKKAIDLHGNNWFGIAAYHSTTPYYNNRYQILIYNELVRLELINDRLTAIPPLEALSIKKNKKSTTSN
jgi:soluble lytic murein transglycosylase-like protein